MPIRARHKLEAGHAAWSPLVRSPDIGPVVGVMSGAPWGFSSLPDDLTEEQLAAIPVLVSVDSLVIEELSDAEADAFAAALDYS